MIGILSESESFIAVKHIHVMGKVTFKILSLIKNKK